jgi:acyl-CoA synthetase (AMP-forming)/AMP-acid ligase II
VYLNQLYGHGRDRPDHLAVVCNGEGVSYRRFAQLIDTVRTHLARSPLPPEGVVAEIADNLLHKWVLLLALRSLGRTTISGDRWSAIERLDVAGIGAVACVGPPVIGTVDPACPIIVVPRSIFTARTGDSVPPPIAETRFGDHIVYTSGTTGTNKKLLLRGDRLDDLILRDLSGTLSRYLGPGEVYHSGNFGPWTIAGYRMSLACWHHGATVIFEQRRSPVDHFFDHPATMTIMLPPALRDLCARFPERPAGAGRMRIMTSGGFVSADLALRAVRQFDCDLFVNYAGTEFRTSLESHVFTQEDVVWLAPTPNSGLEVVDEDDRAIPPGEEGVVRVKLAPSDPTGYIDDPAATAAHFRNGYFYPGDMAIRREDGRVRLLGRESDVLNVGGQKLAVAPLEDQARGFLGVTNLCLFARQSTDGQDILLVVIEGTVMPERTRLEVLTAEFRDKFSETRFALVAKFPRGANGMMKINRRELLEQVG